MPNAVYTVFTIVLVSLMAWAIYVNEMMVQLIVAGITTVYIAIIAYGSANIRANFFVRSVSALPKGKLAITFDDGPSESTLEFLDLLKQEGLKATFFLIGKNIPGNEHIVKRMVEEGHTVGNHSFEHDHLFATRSKKKIIADITKCSELVGKVIGKKPVLFRAPFGVTTPTLAAALKKTNLRSVGWTIRTHDGVREDAVAIEKKLFSKDLNGSIVLFHDTNLNSLEVLEKLIVRTKELGIEVVPLEEEIQAYE